MTDENNTSRIISLGRAIGSTIDLSGTSLSADTCRSLAIVINYTEEDCEVDLSNCSLSTECIERLSACLHKIRGLDVSNNNLNDEATQILASTLSQGDSLHVIDLSSNNITDAGAAKIHDALNGKSNLKVVRIYNNKISNCAIFGKDPRYEI
ncbi:nucleotide-binding oligomerization domain-containing protein 2-like [Erpetoichthys calabaricus]|uniref:nucleotide-binding oligomerization domain-containing protein 2-like n=1 Tax=Erpetoichthys calabaricus TaxID=27687 RepID=UPI002234C285|nr:nucleotide-binding oligomerization domain-containing protein 2-like [Erpetoichthys calabaricus]